MRCGRISIHHLDFPCSPARLWTPSQGKHLVSGQFKGRREDAWLLGGHGRFAADWNLPGSSTAISCAPIVRTRTFFLINYAGTGNSTGRGENP